MKNNKCCKCKKADAEYICIRGSIKMPLCKKCKDRLNKIYGFDEIKELKNDNKRD